MEPPRTIETARLRLRQPVDGDIDAIFEYASDPEVTALMDWRRLTERRQANDFLIKTSEQWRARAEYTWVIVEREIDEVIGAISLRSRDADADFGYVLNRRSWSHGIATEAGTAVTTWALSVQRIPRIWATCDTENHRSMRVLEKLGLKREGLVPGGTIRPNLSLQPRESFLYGMGEVADGR